MMMKLLPKLLISTLVMLYLGAADAVSQTRYQLASSPMLRVSGGSTLHDWHMESSAAKGEAVFLIEAGQFKGAQSLTLTLQAESLKSGTKGLDANAYKALDTSKNKEIKFVLKQLSGSAPTFSANGDLTIAGVTKAVSFPVKVSTSGSNFTFEGSLATKLTNFSVTPPTALMGTVKTEDGVTLSFKTTFQPNL